MNKFLTLIIFFLVLINFLFPKDSQKYSQSYNQVDNLTQAKSVNKSYNINIVFDLKDKQFPDFTVTPLSDSKKVMEATEKIDTFLAKFPSEFFSVFQNNNSNGLNIYLTGKLAPKDKTTQIANPAAYSLIDNNTYEIVIDATTSNLTSILAHELMHNIEFTLQDMIPFPDWNSYNPENFIYNLSYTKPYIYNYTLSEKNPDNIFFIDEYSHTYPDEDRARIFEAICTQNPNILKYPNLYNKALYLKKELINYYPILGDSEVFKFLS